MPAVPQMPAWLVKLAREHGGLVTIAAALLVGNYLGIETLQRQHEMAAARHVEKAMRLKEAVEHLAAIRIDTAVMRALAERERHADSLHLP